MLVAVSVNTNAELFFYSPIVGDSEGIVLSSERDTAFIGHIEVDASSCNYGNEFFCYLFDKHLFSLVDGEIFRDGYRVINHGETKIMLLGRELVLEKISVVSENFNDVFWYSKDNGIQIIQFGIKGLPQKRLFFIRNNCGYGASKLCKN